MTESKQLQSLDTLYQLRHERDVQVFVSDKEAMTRRYEAAKAQFEAQYPGVDIETKLNGMREQELLDELYRLREEGRAQSSASSAKQYEARFQTVKAEFEALHPGHNVEHALDAMGLSKELSAKQYARIANAAAQAGNIEKTEAAVEAAASHKPGWLNRVSNPKLAIGTAGAIAAVGVGVWAWKEYVSKPAQPDSQSLAK